MHKLRDYTASVLPVRDDDGWMRTCLELSQLNSFVEVSYILAEIFGKPRGFPGFRYHMAHCKGLLLLSLLFSSRERDKFDIIVNIPW